MKNPRNEVYHNPKQTQFFSAKQRNKTFVGGIGTGKTTVESSILYNNMVQMPRSAGFILGNTYRQIHKVFLPSIKSMWERFGFKEDFHYVIGRRPPRNWPLAHSSSTVYENQICFINGSSLEMLAADRKDGLRGGSYQHGSIDEAGLIKEEIYTGIVSGRLRGELFRYGHLPCYQSISIFTSMPHLASGMWVINNQQKALEQPDKYFYLESTTHDNIRVLGKDYIKNLEETMDFYTFQREVNNIRYGKLSNCFYSALDEDKHLYSAYDYDFGDHWKDLKIKDADVKSAEPTNWVFDFGGNFNCLSIWQEDKLLNEERCINSFYVNKPLIIDDLIDLACEQFKHHLNRTIYIYGDRNGNSKQGNSRFTFFEQVMDRLRKNGFNPILMYKGNDNPEHELKHFFMNAVLAENDPALPKLRFNKDKSGKVFLSMQNAGITEDFKKDKSSERLLGNNMNRYMATDFSDTADYYIYDKYKNKLKSQNGDLFNVFFTKK